MKYALVTHVPTYAGQSPGVVRMTDAFRDDVLAEAAALRDAGFAMTLATPRHASPDAKALARDRFVDVRLADYGIADAPLPAYRTMPQFLAVRSALKDAIASAIDGAAVVQLDAGGHPMALGEFAWPLVEPAKSKRVFVFAGDPLPARRLAVKSGRNPAKRLGKALAVRTFDAFCRQAVGAADLVFAHDPAVQRRLARVWTKSGHTFTPSPIGDGDLAARPSLDARTVSMKTKAPLRLIVEARREATAGVDHVERAVAKAQRLGAKVTLTTASPLTAAALDAADVFVAAPLVPGEIPSIFLAAARGVPMVCYSGGVADAALAVDGAATVVERGATDGLAQALLDLSRDRSPLAAMSRAALAWATANTRDAVHRQRASLVRGLLVRAGGES